jgi:hypothetical protein
MTDTYRKLCIHTTNHMYEVQIKTKHNLVNLLIQFGKKKIVPMTLTLTLLTWRIWWANNANKWQMVFNWTFKGLMKTVFTAPSLVARTGISYTIRVRIYWHTYYKQATVTVNQWLMLKNNGITFYTWHLANAMWFACKFSCRTRHEMLLVFNCV